MDRVKVVSEAVDILLLVVLYTLIFGMYRFRGFEYAVLFTLGFVAYQQVTDDE